jgi:hypothetical protein
MRAKAVFSPCVPLRSTGRRILFYLFSAVEGKSVGRLAVFVAGRRMAGSGSQSHVFRQLMFQYGTVKNILCFISEQKREKFFVHRSPYSVCIAPVTIRFRHEPQAEQDDARAHHVKHALI